MLLKKVENMKLFRGISLIALIVTIVVTIILLSVVLISIDKNNPRKGATEDVFKSDFRALEEELAMKKAEVKQQDLSADINVTVEYNDEEELKTWISSIDKSILNGVVQICNGELVFVDKGLSEDERKWAEEVGALVDSCEEYTEKRGGFYFIGNVQGNNIESYTWTNQDVTISVDTSYAEDIRDEYNSYIYSIDSGSYNNYSGPFLVSANKNTSKTARIKGVAKSSNLTNESIDFMEDYVVKIDKINPTAPDIIKSEYGDKYEIVLSGAKDADSGIARTEYSLDKGNTWITYNSPITIDTAVDTVYSRAWDVAGNVTSEDEYKTLKVNVSALSSIEVTSPQTGMYKAGTKVTIEAKFTGGTPSVNPALNLAFGSGSARAAQATNRTSSVISYEYVITDGDNGVMEIASETYNGKSNQKLGGYTITADTIKPALSYVGATINGETRDLVIDNASDKVTISFKATDLNINQSTLASDDVKLLVNGREVSTLSKTFKASEIKDQSINYELTLTNFKNESGNYSIIVPAGKVSDKALNYNDEYDSSMETTIPVVVNIDNDKPEITKVEMTSNNAVGGSKHAKNSNKVTLKVNFNEVLGTVPSIKIGGRNATLKSSATGKAEYEAYIEIPSGEVSLTEGWLGYSISGYKDASGNSRRYSVKRYIFYRAIRKNR